MLIRPHPQKKGRIARHRQGHRFKGNRHLIGIYHLADNAALRGKPDHHKIVPRLHIDSFTG